MAYKEAYTLMLLLFLLDIILCIYLLGHAKKERFVSHLKTLKITKVPSPFFSISTALLLLVYVGVFRMVVNTDVGQATALFFEVFALLVITISLSLIYKLMIEGKE